MKTRYKIVILIAAAVAVFSFYMFMVANGYSPYMEGISMTYYNETDPQKIMHVSYMESVTAITEKNLDEVPRIRGMLEVALRQEFPLHDDGFALFDSGLNSYWMNRDDGNIDVKISMSGDETEKHAKWLQENVPGRLMEYKGRYFSFSTWIA